MTSTADVVPARPRSGLAEPVRLASRYPSLDGLRGVAAVVVVVFHVLMLSPVFTGEAASGGPGTWQWWLINTPLAVLWSGPEAVVVFFVLSGFVLALPATGAGGVRAVPWRSYYPRRLVRLYLPVWASLLFALALLTLVPPAPVEALSGWYDEHVPVQPLSATARDAGLLLGVGWLNSPLWSLRWEVLFSLLLPAYLLLLARARSPQWVAAGYLGIGVVTVLGAATGAWGVTYLVMFALGVLLARDRERLSVLARRLSARSGIARWAWPALAAASVLLLSHPQLVFGFGHPRPLVGGLSSALQLSGAALLVVLALHWAPLASLLSRGSVQWLGTHSFSLYLTHEPLLVASVTLLPDLTLGPRLLVVLAASLLLARVFFLVVEAPAQRLSRRAGRWGQRREREAAPRPLSSPYPS